MKRKQLLRTGISVFLASVMMITSIPAASQAAAEDRAADSTSVLDSALANYDFEDYTANAAGNLQSGDTVITLEGSGTKPTLAQDEKRGQVLSLTEQEYANRADALLPSNPFAGKPVDNGFTLNFWTKTTGTAGGARCLIDFELAPAAADKRAGTLAVNQGMLYWNTTDQNEKFTDFATGNLGLSAKNVWKMVTLAVTTEGIKFYSDGVEIVHTVNNGAADYSQMIKDMAGISGICTDPAQTNVRLGASLATYWSCAGAMLDDISFYGKALSAEEVARLYQETCIQTALESVTVSGDKTVDEDRSIQLSAALTPADTTVDRTVTWASSDESVLTVDEKGKAFGVKGGTATVTATVAGITSAPFEITVNGIDYTESLEPGYYLTVYSTTKNFYASASSIEEETQSVYMAVSKDGKTFDVLKNNGGVIYAKEGSRRIISPQIYKEGSEFVVIAPDNTASSGYHIFTSEDGVNYYDEVLQTSVPDDYNKETPLKRSKFPLMLNGQNILETDDTISLGNAVEITETEYSYIVNKLGTVVNTGLESLSDVIVSANTDIVKTLSEKYPSVNATYSDGSTQKFNIDWSDAAKGVDLTKAGTYTLNGKVVQTKYLNNLKELNGSTLPEDDPGNDSDTELDNYDEETGHVYYDNTKFVEGMADPNIYYDEVTGYYYMTGSYFPENGDAMEGETPDQYDRVVLRRGKTLEELQKRSEQVTIWKVGNQGYEDNGNQVASGYRYIWAPEIHRVGDYWVVYFTESHGSLFNIYCHALVLDGDKDPYETALKTSDGVSQWEDHKMCVDGSFADPFATAFCLDMTYFKDEANGESYVIWPGKPSIGNTDLYIAKVSETEPWKITSAAAHISQPDYGWERVRAWVNEGPTVLQKDDKIFLCYSASGTGSEYAIGMLTATQGDNLLDSTSWTKSPYPVLTSRDVEGEEGPGHNSFTVDKDGNAIFVYHARPTSHNYQHCGWDGTKSLHYNGEPLNDPCRHARLKRVHWAADGTPILKMTYEEELLAEYQTVSVKVLVTGISLDKSTLSLEAGKSATLQATVIPANTTVTWTTSNSAIATVDQNGKVTGQAAGTANITATADGKSATCTVTVTKASETRIPVTKVTLSKTKLTLGVKETFTLTAKVTPSNATNKNVTWKSNKTGVVTVKKGKLTAKKKGTAKITATADGKSATCTVTVKAAPKKIQKLNKTKVTIKKGKTFKIKVTLPKNTASNKITYTSKKKKIATVSSAGVIKGVKKGTTTITVKTFNNKKKTIKVTVK